MSIELSLPHKVTNAIRYRFHTSPPKPLQTSRDVKANINRTLENSDFIAKGTSTIMGFNARQVWMNIAIRVWMKNLLQAVTQIKS